MPPPSPRWLSRCCSDMVEIRTSQSVYPVRFCSTEEALEFTEGTVVVTDDNVADSWPDLAKSCRRLLSVAAGESSKSMASLEVVLEWMGEQGLRRSDQLVAWGGGVVGDLAGFAAATYMRGIPYIQVPTTLLAMVDSSVGGKVGIDLHAGKNLAGAFHPPTEVRIAPEFLRSLPEREFINGMAEVWKYAFIMDAPMVETLSAKTWSTISTDLPALIERCVRHKAAVVMEDEFETLGRRSILNFGHTIGHGIERMLGYRDLLHGEAIAIGMVMETRIGIGLGITPAHCLSIVSSSLTRTGLPVDWQPQWDPEAVLQAMLKDKKRRSEGLAISLLEDIGKCKLIDNIPLATVRNLLGA